MFNKFFKRIENVTRNETGSVSVYFIIFMIFFLPFSIWIGVQLPLKYEAGYKVNQMAQNTADSIVSRLDHVELANGRVAIDLVEAEEVSNMIVRTVLNLDEHNNPSGKGLIPRDEKIPIELLSWSTLEKDTKSNEYLLPEEVGVYVYVINNPTETIKIKNLLPLDKTSVVVHAVIPVEDGGMFGHRNIIKRTGVAEAEIYTGEDD